MGAREVLIESRSLGWQLMKQAPSWVNQDKKKRFVVVWYRGNVFCCFESRFEGVSPGVRG